MIEEKDVRRIARLARLRLGPDEAVELRNQLGKILDWMAELSELDTSHVEPTASVLGLSNIMRDDRREDFPEPQRLLANAPDREGPFFKVRRVLE